MATSSTGEWLSATPTPSGAKYAKVTWSSANQSIAKVTAGGKVIPVAEGDVTITASTADGSVLQTCLVHVKTAPTPVSKLTASQKPVGVSWTPVEGVDGYNFYVSLTEQGDYQKAGSVLNQSDVATITAAPTGLSQGYRYYIYVKSYKEIDGHQYESVASNYTFYTEPIDAPTNFKATKITKDSVTVTWDSVAAATGYSPRCYDTGDTSAFVETTQYTFTGLEKGKSYIFYVYACGQLVNSSRVLSDGVSIKVTTADDENEVFDITYNLDGGTNNSSNPATYTKTTDTIKLANPTRTGYAFAGWYSDAAYTTKVTQIAKGSTGDKTFYAKWTPNSYTIKFNGNGASSGTMSSMTNCKYGTKYTLSSNAFKKPGYYFAGWNTKADGSGTTYANKASVMNLTSRSGGSVTLYAQWKIPTYTIAYHGNGSTSGTMSAKKGCKYGTSYTLSANAYRRSGYSFTGWNTKADGSGKAYANKATVKNLSSSNGSTVTLYAQWKKVKYTISYNLNGGTNNSGNPTGYYVTSSTITLKNPTRRGYTFVGWYSDSQYKNKVTQIAKGSVGNKTLYARWTATKYKITYSLNGGTNNSKNPATYTIASSNIALQSPTRRGYSFGGWYSDSSYKNRVTQISKGSVGNKTLYAKWNVVTYKITYNLNSGTNNSNNPTSYKVTTSTITLQKPTRRGYTFGGWYTNSNFSGSKVTQIVKGSVGNKNLYAKWSKTKYTITYNLNGGTNNSKNPAYYYITSNTVTLQNPTRKGYTFGGWYSDSGYKTRVKEITKGSVGKKTLYAKWIAK